MRTEENLIKAKQAKKASERKVLIDNITSQKMEYESLVADVNLVRSENKKLRHKIVKSRKIRNFRIRLLSHITFGKLKKHYKNKWREIKRVLKND